MGVHADQIGACRIQLHSPVHHHKVVPLSTRSGEAGGGSASGAAARECVLCALCRVQRRGGRETEAGAHGEVMPEGEVPQRCEGACPSLRPPVEQHRPAVHVEIRALAAASLTPLCTSDACLRESALQCAGDAECASHHA